MAVEAIKYGIKSVGHNVPESEHKVVEPSCDFDVAFEKWLRQKNNRWIEALDAVKPLGKLHVDEVHGALVKYQHLFKENTVPGIFVSAAYHQCEERVIYFDIPHLPLSDVACYFPKNKVFVNVTRLGCFVGTRCMGLFINLGEISSDSGVGCRGIVINFGETSYNFGNMCERNSTVINLGTALGGIGFNGGGMIFSVVEPRSVLQSPWSSESTYKYYTPKECALIPGLNEYFVLLKLRAEARELDDVSRESVEKDIAWFLNGGSDDAC